MANNRFICRAACLAGLLYNREKNNTQYDGSNATTQYENQETILAKCCNRCFALRKRMHFGRYACRVLLLIFPVVLFGSKLYGSWLIDFVFAFAIGIIFQYYAIKPMKKLSSGKALKAALQAAALSLTAWQIGMYGGMAIATLFFLNIA